MAQWQFILTDLNGDVHGELTTASERKVGLPHMRVPSAGCMIPMNHGLADTALTTDCLIKAYRQNSDTTAKVLAFNGPIVSAEEVSDGQKQGIAIVAAGPYWRLSKRIIGKNAGGYAHGIPTPVDLGLAAHTILDATNGEGFTGIGKGTRGAVTTGGFGPWYHKNVAEGIAELTAGINSFEFVVDPIEAQAEPGGVGGWPRIGNMRIASYIGALQPDVILEYGTGRANVASYSRAISREGMITRATISVEGWPDTPVKNSVPPYSPQFLAPITRDSDQIATRGLFEEVIPDASVTNDTLRTQIADFHLFYRKIPREIITFVPAINSSPAPLTDYMPGDTIRARAVVNGTLRFDSLFRIWGVTFNIDQTGNETIELELVRP